MASVRCSFVTGSLGLAKNDYFAISQEKDLKSIVFHEEVLKDNTGMTVKSTTCQIFFNAK